MFLMFSKEATIINEIFTGDLTPTKAKSNYRGSAENPAHQKFYIHFFIDNSNANLSLFALSCPDFNLGQLNTK